MREKELELCKLHKIIEITTGPRFKCSSPVPRLAFHFKKFNMNLSPAQLRCVVIPGPEVWVVSLVCRRSLAIHSQFRWATSNWVVIRNLRQRSKVYRLKRHDIPNSSSSSTNRSTHDLFFLRTASTKARKARGAAGLSISMPLRGCMDFSELLWFKAKSNNTSVGHQYDPQSQANFTLWPKPLRPSHSLYEARKARGVAGLSISIPLRGCMDFS